MKERPILFSGRMVRAILENRKTQTRRVTGNYGVPGDRLWVRETLFCGDDNLWRYSADNGQVGIECANPTAMVVWALHKKQDYCSSIFMPRWASRITVEITDVRIQCLQEISEEDAMAEGISECLIPADDEGPNRIGYMVGPDDGMSGLDVSPRDSFRKLWDSINAKRGFGWHTNPRVRALTFRRME
jgi:hypothetical protein